MNVIFVTNLPSPYRVDFFNELGKTVSLTVIYERHSAADRNTAWKGNDAIHFIEKYANTRPVGTDRSAGLGIVRMIKGERFNHIVFCGYSSPAVMLAIAYCRLKKIPYYIESDGGFCKTDRFWVKRLKKFLIHDAIGHFVTCEEYKKYLLTLGVREKRIHKYPFTSLNEACILKKPLNYDEKAELRKQLGLPDGILIVSVGQFIYRKGFDILLKALPSVNNSVNVIIIGGEVTKEYHDLCEKLKLKNVTFVPFLEKSALFRFYKAADIFCLPTREDIWGLVINEAMACGMPIISTNKCIAATELVENGCNGIVVKADDVEALADGINYLLSCDMLEMGDESIRTIRNYSIEKMAQKHIEILRKENKKIDDENNVYCINV